MKEALRIETLPVTRKPAVLPTHSPNKNFKGVHSATKGRRDYQIVHYEITI